MDMSDAVIVKSSRLKSVVWNDFDRLKKGEICVAVCRHCKKKLSGSSTSGTSHLRNHLIRCQRRSNHGLVVSNHAIPNAISNHPITQFFTPKGKKKGGGGGGGLSNISDQDQIKDTPVSVMYDNMQIKEDTFNHNLDQRRSRFDLARMMIIHGYSLTMVDHTGFKLFVKNLQPSFELVGFESVESDCMEIYAKEKQKVFDLLDKLPESLDYSNTFENLALISGSNCCCVSLSSPE
ncbi:hypothetical protein ACFE04_006835 [Oxalis oulophora]